MYDNIIFSIKHLEAPIIFAGLTAYDTQVIKEIYVENENSEESSKKAVMGALKLYLDLLLLFQYLLMLFGNRE